MQLTPRYGAAPALVLDVEPGSILGAAVKQRRRLAETVSAFSAEEWQHPSRCDGWTARDVINHLHTTTGFWIASIGAGLAGAPTTLLTTFDPVASPAALAEADRALADAEVSERFAASTDSLIDLLESLTPEQWQLPAEAPAGHITIEAVVHHALWDAWIHERDILLPMGRTPAVEDDEVIACLRFAAALGPVFAANRGESRTGVLAVSASDPEAHVRVEVGETTRVSAGPADGDLLLEGQAVDLVELFSVRRPLDDELVRHPAAWLLAGLRVQFDEPVSMG